MFLLNNKLIQLTKIVASPINITQVRFKPNIQYVSCIFPTEVKRVRKQGYTNKVKTVNGRRILMQRILDGKKVIAH